MTWQSSQGYQMWRCGLCGCLGIAASLEICPMCFKPRGEAEVPRTTVGGGGTNANAKPGETGYRAPDKPARKPAKPAEPAEPAKAAEKAAPATGSGE